MIKSIKDLSNLIKIDTDQNNQEYKEKTVFCLLSIIKKETGINIKEEDIIIKKNILKIKTNSNIRFIILLHLDIIKSEFLKMNQDFILEL